MLGQLVIGILSVTIGMLLATAIVVVVSTNPKVAGWYTKRVFNTMEKTDEVVDYE